MTRLSAHTRIQRSDGVLQQRSGSDTVLLAMSSGHYYALDEVGSEIWELLTDSTTIAELAQTLAQRYDAPLDVLENDIAELLSELADEHLVVCEESA